MLDKNSIDRINELARKSKISPLSEEEKMEQNELRQAYLSKFREHFRGHLESIEIVDDLPEDNIKSKPPKK